MCDKSLTYDGYMLHDVAVYAHHNLDNIMCRTKSGKWKPYPKTQIDKHGWYAKDFMLACHVTMGFIVDIRFTTPIPKWFRAGSKVAVVGSGKVYTISYILDGVAYFDNDPEYSHYPLEQLVSA